ncbi:MAG: RnfABCDGE type electron transport complex subunit G [Lachnospiraceae bacterium]|nr:RnfABCDGE type electron transport complex subunit G [Lachnospiraceae bacterium]
MNKLVKDALILTLITLIAGVALGAVYQITKDPIAKAQEAKTKEAYMAVFPDAASFSDLGGFNSEEATKVAADAGYTKSIVSNAVEALDGSGNRLGYVITMVSKEGYGGSITFSMGIANDGTMYGYSITDISETAGLGMKATDQPKDENDTKAFVTHFYNKNASSPLTVVKGSASSDTEIEAISGATITSRAMTNAVNAGFAYFNSLTGGAAE